MNKLIKIHDTIESTKLYTIRKYKAKIIFINLEPRDTLLKKSIIGL